MKKILVLGCGLKRFPHSIHLDINSEVNPDVVWDLMKYPRPFEDNRFKSIVANHILEHMWVHGDEKGFFKLFREIWRICQNGAEINIEVPYGLGTFAFCDPGHKSFWVPILFSFLSKKQYKRARETKNMMTQYSIDFDFDIKNITLVAEKQGQPPMFLRVVLGVIK